MIVDTLEILLEANSRGLQSQLKRSSETIKSFVSSMNKQEVSWTSILTRTIQPAIITGIAGMFATAITQAVSFQKQVSDAAIQSSGEYEQSYSDIDKSAKKISSATGQSTSEVADALATISRSTLDAAAQYEVVYTASLLAQKGFGELNEITKILGNSMSNWGITTAEEAKTALNSLFNSASVGKFTMLELANEMEKVGVALRDKISFSDAVGSLAAFSAQTQITKEVASESFSKIAEAAQNPLDSINIMVGGVGRIADVIKEKGIVGAFQEVAEAIQKYPTAAAVELGKNFGLSADAVTQFRNTSIPQLQEVYDELDKIKSKQLEVNEALRSSYSFWDNLKVLFQSIKNTLGDIFRNALSQLGNLFTEGKLPEMGGAKSALSGVGEDFSKVGNFFSELFEKIFSGGKDKTDTMTGDNTKNLNITNNWNMSIPKGSETAVPQNLVSEMYKQFNEK